MSRPTDYPSFVDLRAHAKQGAIAPSGNPYRDGRHFLSLPPGPVEVGSIHLPIGHGDTGLLEGDEFVIVAEGNVTFGQGAQNLDLREGQSCVLTGDAPFQWSASAPATLIFMRYRKGSVGPARIVPIEIDSELVPSGAPLAELLVGETPSCRNHTTFLSADGTFMAGVWDSTPYHRRAMAYRHFELMYLLRGNVTFVDEQRRSQTFGEGDIFLVEQHAQCSWESREDVAKVFAIYRPAA